MTIEELRQTAMQRRVAEGLAVVCAMPGHEPVTLYFASPASRDDFMRRAILNGATVGIAERPG